MDLKELQHDRATWIAKNFPPRPPHHPVLGMVEEFGELMEAIGVGDVHEIGSTLADVVLSAADLCDAFEFDLGKLWAETAAHFDGNGLEPSIPLGRLCYAALKTEQGLDGAPPKHVHALRHALLEILACVMCAAQISGVDVLAHVRAAWEAVSQRTLRCQNPRCWKPLREEDAGEHCSLECRATSVNGLF